MALAVDRVRNERTKTYIMSGATWHSLTPDQETGHGANQAGTSFYL